MLLKKLGAGIRRHIKGQLLWFQASGDLCIKQVKTLQHGRPQHQVASQGQTPFPSPHVWFCLQWRVCRRDRVCKSIQIGQAKTSKSNQMAKQSFRALSIFSVMSLAEGNHFPNLLQMIHEGSPNALSSWCSTWSPINMISTALLFILAVPPVGIQQNHEGSG